MNSKQSILGLVYTGGEIRRPPLVGMQFLHERAVRPADIATAPPRLQAKDLIGLLVRHFAARRRAALPPCRISLRVLTPGGTHALNIACKSLDALVAEAGHQRSELRQIEFDERVSAMGPGRDPADKRAAV